MTTQEPPQDTVNRLVQIIEDGANYLEGLVASHHTHRGHWRDCRYDCSAWRAPAEKMRADLEKATGTRTETNIGPFDARHQPPERDRLIADIRRRLPYVAVGHPDLAAEVGRAMDLVERSRGRPAPRLPRGPR